jgi:pimeloyl-ACP methyl ester carboxylesterase
MKNIYIFSGLGTDQRVFQLIDFSGADITFIHWLHPVKNETIGDYAKRLAEQIKADRPILIGLSFGGIIAIEVAKFIDTEKIILISSAKTEREIPFYYRLAGRLNLHTLIPVRLLKRPNIFTYWFFGVHTKQDKKLLAEVLSDTNPVFLKWAIEKIVTWTNTTRHKNLRHIHGIEDKILPIRYVGPDVKINNGGHFMIVNKATELSELLKHEIS